MVGRATEEAMGTAPSRYFVWGPQPAAAQGMMGTKSRQYTIESTDHVSCPGRWLLSVGLCGTQDPGLHHSSGGTWALRSLCIHQSAPTCFPRKPCTPANRLVKTL